MNGIQVGINNNVFLKNVVSDDKLWLTLTFEQEQKIAYSPFEAIGAENEAIEKPISSMDVKIFNLKVPKATDMKGNTRTTAQIEEMVTRDITKLKATLLHFLKGYLTKDQIKFDVYRATGITADNYGPSIRQQNILDQITKNLHQDFITMVTSFLTTKQLFRLLLIRQSKDKHFATLRDNYLDENPIWESMEVPEEATKVKFTKYEIDNGLNDPTPTSKSSADKPGEAAPEVTAASVFGG